MTELCKADRSRVIRQPLLQGPRIAGMGSDDDIRSGFGRAAATDKYHRSQYEQPDEWSVWAVPPYTLSPCTLETSEIFRKNCAWGRDDPRMLRQ